MIDAFGDADLHIAVESGALPGVNGDYDAKDVAIVHMRTRHGAELIARSDPFPFPVLQDSSGLAVYPIVEARHRGFAACTGGDIIHELMPNIPSNSWQDHFPGASGESLSRVAQIKTALTSIPALLPELLNQDAMLVNTELTTPPPGL